MQAIPSRTMTNLNAHRRTGLPILVGVLTLVLFVLVSGCATWPHTNGGRPLKQLGATVPYDEVGARLGAGHFVPSMAPSVPSGPSNGDTTESPEDQLEAPGPESPDGEPSEPDPLDLSDPFLNPDQDDTNSDPFGDSADRSSRGRGDRATVGFRRPASPDEFASGSPGELLSRSRQALEGLTNYQVLLSRQERIHDRMPPFETVLMSIRRQPRMAVRLEWTEGPEQGRVVIYDSADPLRKMHVKMASPLPPMSLDPDSALVRSNSRHAIYHAGFDTILTRMEEALASSVPEEQRLRGLGEISVPGRDEPCPAFGRLTPSGEYWIVALDPESYLPAFVQAKNAQGELLERHVFGRVQGNLEALVQGKIFEPYSLGIQASGFLRRLADQINANTSDMHAPDLQN